MGDKAWHRTKRWIDRLTARLLAEEALNAAEEYNFNRLKALGIIKEGK